MSFAKISGVIGIVSLSIGLIFFTFNKVEQNEKEAYQAGVTNCLEDATVYRNRQKRISTMETTLMVHYKLSKWEAHYYSIIFDDYAQRYDSLFRALRVDWHIFPAVMRIESNYDATIKSNKNAKGLMQLLEPTAKDLIKILNKEDSTLQIEYEPSKTLWNDVININLGCEYLCRMIAQQKSLAKGIKAYNGGPGFSKSRKDIGKYRTNVKWEYERLQYIHKGVSQR